jgi:hypothetical protein
VNEMPFFLLAVAGFLLVLCLLGAIADTLDPYGERADARRRNRP